jgi:uncharacterized coiled-coil DUF342 family protein
MWGILNRNKERKVFRFISYIDDRTKNLLEWIKFFSHKHDEHDKRLEEIEQKLTLMPSETDIRNLIDMHYLNHDTRTRLNELHSRLNNIAMMHHHVPERIKTIQERIHKIEQKHSLLTEKHDGAS